MNHAINRITSVFLCHPNSKVISREIEMAMAHCGLLASQTDTDTGVEQSVVRLFSGAGMWHVLEVAPIESLWTRRDLHGASFFQLLGKQLLAPGFAGITAQEGLQGEVFLELDAQGNMRASGSWDEQNTLGSIALMQPIQPFSSGLKSLWAAGQTQAAIEGVKGVTPVQAFLRMALHRLGGEQLANNEDWSASLVYEARFVPAAPEAVAAFLAEKQTQLQTDVLAREQGSAARLSEEAASLPASSNQALDSVVQDKVPLEQSSETNASNVPNEAMSVAGEAPALHAQAMENDGLPSAQTPVVHRSVDEPSAQNFDTALLEHAVPDLLDSTSSAIVEEVLEHVYVDGQVVGAGDVLAIDDGLSSGRLQGITPDEGDRAGFIARVEVAPDRVQTQGGAVFLARAKCIAKGVDRYSDAEQRVIEWLEQRVSEQDVRAMVLMGIRLLQGTGVEKDPRRAYEHLSSAAEQGSPMAQYLVGSMSKSPSRSIRYWKKAADQGHAPSWFLLGLAHFKGNGVQADETQARHAFEQAARLGHLPSIYNLGVMQTQCEQALIEEPDAKPALFQMQALEGNAVASWVLAQAAMRSGKEAEVEQAGRLLMQSVIQGFAPAGDMLVALLASDELNAVQRIELMTALTQNASDSVTLQRVLGSAQTQSTSSPAEAVQGVVWLQQAVKGHEAQALEELNRVKMDLLARAADLLSRVSEANGQTVSLEDVQFTAQALQALVDGGEVSLGPNALVQLQRLYEVAEQLGDASASEKLAKLRGGPSWAQAQLLEQVVRPEWANGALDGLGQLESLNTLPPPEEAFPNESHPHAARIDGALKAADGISEAFNTSDDLKTPEVVKRAAVISTNAMAAGVATTALASTASAMQMVAAEGSQQEHMVEASADEVLLEFTQAEKPEPALKGQQESPPLDVNLALDDSQKLDPDGDGLDWELDLQQETNDNLITALSFLNEISDEPSEAKAPLKTGASLDESSNPVIHDAVSARIAQAKAQALAEEEAMQERLRDTLVLNRSDDQYESSLSEDDLAILGAFKNMPSFDVLETMSAPEDIEDFQSSFATQSEDTQGRHSLLGEDAGPTSVMPKADSVLPEQGQTVFEPEAKKKAWWKFW